MDTEKAEVLQGKKIEILEMALKQVDGQLVLSWKISFENTVFRMTFSNVSRFRIGEVSIPLEIHGLKMIGRKIPHTKFVISKMIVSVSSARISKLMNDCPLSIYALLQEFPKNYSGNER